MSGTRARAIAAVAAAGAAGLLLSACGGGSSGSSSSGASASGGGTTKATAGKITIGATSAGRVLVDPKGMTLYAFAPDSRGHSTCTGSCASYWPPVAGADASSGAAGKVTAHLGTIKRSDGSSQLTVNGFPMYTYVGDSGAGQAKGQGQNSSGGLWWVVSPTGAWVKGGASGSGASGGGSGY